MFALRKFWWWWCMVLGLYKTPGKFANNKLRRASEGEKFASICGFPLIPALDFYAFMVGQPAISPAIVLRCSEYLRKLPPTSYSWSGCDCEALSLASFVFECSRWFAKLSMGLQVQHLANKRRVKYVLFLGKKLIIQKWANELCEMVSKHSYPYSNKAF